MILSLLLSLLSKNDISMNSLSGIHEEDWKGTRLNTCLFFAVENNNGGISPHVSRLVTTILLLKTPLQTPNPPVFFAGTPPKDQKSSASW